jgi:hypothetical protein
VPVMRLHPVAAGGEAFQRIFPDGLQQREPRLAATGVRLDQAAVHQRAQRFQHQPRLLGLALDREPAPTASAAGRLNGPANTP